MSNRKGDTKLKYAVFQRSDSKTYSMRFSIEGLGQQVVPLRTTDKKEADDKAYIKAIEIMHGLNNDNYSGNITFAKVADDYLKQKRKDAEHSKNPKRALANVDYQSRTIEMYLKTFFDKCLSPLKLCHYLLETGVINYGPKAI